LGKLVAHLQPSKSPKRWVLPTLQSTKEKLVPTPHGSPIKG
jgi:hypothetical protein